MNFRGGKILKRLVAGLGILTLLAGASAPREGELVELEGFLHGRDTADFSPGYGDNIRYVLPPGTHGRIERVVPFASGNFGLLIEVLAGPRRGQQAWIHYNPSRGEVELCADEESSACHAVPAPAQAHRVITRRPVPAIAAWIPLPAALPAAQPASASASRARTAVARSSSAPPRVTWISEPAIETTDSSGSPGSPGSLDEQVRDLEGELGAVNANRALDEIRRASEPPRIVCTTRREPEAPPGRSCFDRDKLLPGLRPNFLAMRSGGPREQAFIEHVAVWAVQSEAMSRIPASVTIAQAALESGFGTSRMYRYSDEVFGISCTHFGSTVHYIFVEQGVQRPFQGKCYTTGATGRYFVRFADPRLSVLAHDSVILTNPAYRGIQQVIARTPRSAVVDWRRVVANLAGYDPTNRGYRDQVTELIRRYRLDRFDRQVYCGRR